MFKLLDQDFYEQNKQCSFSFAYIFSFFIFLPLLFLSNLLLTRDWHTSAFQSFWIHSLFRTFYFICHFLFLLFLSYFCSADQPKISITFIYSTQLSVAKSTTKVPLKWLSLENINSILTNSKLIIKNRWVPIFGQSKSHFGIYL